MSGILHLATNMWCLWNLGLLAEPLMGSFGVIAVYILTGAAGNLLSTLIEPDSTITDLGAFPAGAGASGAVFGIAGALIVLLKSTAAARASRRSEEAAPLGDLLCGHQPRDRRRNLLRDRRDRQRHSHRQLCPPRRSGLRAAVCLAHGAAAGRPADALRSPPAHCRRHDRRAAGAVRVISSTALPVPCRSPALDRRSVQEWPCKRDFSSFQARSNSQSQSGGRP